MMRSQLCHHQKKKNFDKEIKNLPLLPQSHFLETDMECPFSVYQLFHQKLHLSILWLKAGYFPYILTYTYWYQYYIHIPYIRIYVLCSTIPKKETIHEYKSFPIIMNLNIQYIFRYSIQQKTKDLFNILTVIRYLLCIATNLPT